MEHRLLTKDVLLIKNAIPNVEEFQKFILESKTNGDKWFGNWEDWRPWGQYSKAYPSEDDSYMQDNSKGAELLKASLDSFFNALQIYKDNYMNEDYFKKINESSDIATSMSDIKSRKNFIADVVILESENTDTQKNLSMEYHVDRRWFIGGNPYIFNYNIYTNDNYDGGEIMFIDTEDAQRVPFTDKNGNEKEYYLVDKPISYKMEAGDGLLFRTDHYHAVTPVEGNKFYIRQFLVGFMSKEYLDKQKSMNEEDFNNFIKEKEKKYLETFAFQTRIFNSPAEIDDAFENSIICVVKSV